MLPPNCLLPFGLNKPQLFQLQLQQANLFFLLTCQLSLRNTKLRRLVSAGLLAPPPSRHGAVRPTTAALIGGEFGRLEAPETVAAVADRGCFPLAWQLCPATYRWLC